MNRWHYSPPSYHSPLLATPDLSEDEDDLEFPPDLVESRPKHSATMTSSGQLTPTGGAGSPCKRASGRRTPHREELEQDAFGEEVFVNASFEEQTVLRVADRLDVSHQRRKVDPTAPCLERENNEKRQHSSRESTEISLFPPIISHQFDQSDDKAVSLRPDFSLSPER
uniref:ARAD1D16698p n=1 Tax=Blastobotrys adeninivorans TaxID=409370 RepID=A0A060TFP8_BLAAD